MKNLVIFGTGEFGEIVHYYFRHDSAYSIAAFTLDAAYVSEATFQSLPVVAFEELETRFPPSDYDVFVAMGIQKVNRQRAAKVAEVLAKGYTLASYLSSKAKVADGFVIRPNSCVMEEAFLQPFVEVGCDTIIWPRSTIGFHGRIGNHCWLVAPTMGESVVVGDFSFLGLNSTIAPCTRIGASNVIGAGALILHNTRDDEIYKGHASEASRVPSHRLRHI